MPTDKIKEGRVVLKNQYISIDAAMRTWINGLPNYIEPVKVGDVMKARVIGEVIFSKSKLFQVGDKVIGDAGWEKYSVVSEKAITKIPTFIKDDRQFLAMDISGLTAYFGL